MLIGFAATAQKTENVILVTLDGLRWQEVFNGADASLLNNEEFTESIERTSNKFWDESAAERRQLLMPFLWSTVKENGVILGNRALGSKVDIKNKYGFSYPGYNEILTGYPDDKVDSNDKKYNENVTVLEYLNNQPKLKGKVAAFSTWDVFPYIINDKRSGIYVNSAGKEYEETNSPNSALLNEIQEKIPSLASGRFDYLTYFMARDYLQEKNPNVLYIAFDETDEFAHEGKYRDYLYAANTIDGFLEDLWNYCQSTEQYKDKTTIIVATDHGRGDKVKEQWQSHGQKVEDCQSIWIAAIGPDIKNLGEVSTAHQSHQNQIAATVAKLLGYTFENGHEIGEPIQMILK